jgi:hypothetical protein
MKLIRLIKICLYETYNRVRIVKPLSDMFPIKTVLIKGAALSPLLFNFALECAIRGVQVNRIGLKLTGTHQFLVYADDVNVLGGSVHTTEKNADVSVVASKGTGLVANAEKTEYMFMSRDQNAGQNRNIKIHNKLFERVKHFKYLETSLTNQNSIHEENQSTLRSGNACCHSVQNLLPSSLLSKTIKIKIQKTVILSVVLNGYENWSHIEGRTYAEGVPE